MQSMLFLEINFVMMLCVVYSLQSYICKNLACLNYHAKYSQQLGNYLPHGQQEDVFLYDNCDEHEHDYE